MPGAYRGRVSLQGALLAAVTVILLILAVAQVIERHAERPADAGPVTIDWVFAERSPAFLAFYDSVIEQFEREHPGVRVRYRYLAKITQRLPTLIASSDRPDVIYTQGAGLLQRLYRAGAIRDLAPRLRGTDWEDGINPAALANYEYDGRLLGVPQHVTMNDFYYNRELFSRVGLDAAEIVTWQDFLAAVRRLQEAGITPIAAGPLESWAVGIYLGLFSMRTCGELELRAAIERRERGFVDPCFTTAVRMLDELVEAGAFQRGVAATDYAQSMGLFGDGRAAMVLSFSSTTVQDQRRNASDGRGLPPERIGFFPVPEVEGTPGRRTDTYGGIAGWAVMTGAPDEAITFVRYLTSERVQRRFASMNIQIPVRRAAVAEISDPLLREAADRFADSTWHQIYIEDEMGAAVGKTLLSAASGILGGGLSPDAVGPRLQYIVDSE